VRLYAVFQTLGGAFGISAGQAAFVNRIIVSVPQTAPGVDPSVVVATGVTELRSVFPGNEITGILLAYMEGLRAAFAVGIAMAGMAFLISLLSKWNRIHVQL
jgi:hypothetical protein